MSSIRARGYAAGREEPTGSRSCTAVPVIAAGTAAAVPAAFLASAGTGSLLAGPLRQAAAAIAASPAVPAHRCGGQLAAPAACGYRSGQLNACLRPARVSARLAARREERFPVDFGDIDKAAGTLLGAYASRVPVASLTAAHPGLPVDDAYAWPAGADGLVDRLGRTGQGA